MHTCTHIRIHTYTHLSLFRSHIHTHINTHTHLTHINTHVLICHRYDLHSEQVLFADGTDHEGNDFLSFDFDDDGDCIFVNTLSCVFMSLMKCCVQYSFNRLWIFREWYRNIFQIWYMKWVIYDSITITIRKSFTRFKVNSVTNCVFNRCRIESSYYHDCVILIGEYQ